MSGNPSGKQRVWAAFCGLVVVVSIAAVKTSAPPAAEDRQALTAVTIALIPVEAAASVFYAKDRGFLRRQGIDAKLMTILDPTQIAAACLSGNAQFCSNSMGGLAVAKARGAPLKLVASGALYRPLAPTTVLVARKGRPIRNARGLVGKKVAVDALNAIPHVAMRRWLKRNGVRETAVDFRPIPFAQMLAPLTRGEVDAAVIAEPFLTLALQRGATLVTNVFRVVCPEICLLTGWIARNDVDPILAAKFRNAVQAASVWADQEKNHRASAAILSRYTSIDEAVIRKMTRAYFAQRLVPRLAQPWIDVYAEFGIIPASFPAIQLVK